MSAPCPTCHRVGTIQWINGRGTCYGCDPPDPALYVLVEIDIRGKVFCVEKRWEAELQRFLAGQSGHRIVSITPKGRKVPQLMVESHEDTGMCGNDAIRVEYTPLEQYVSNHWSAFPKDEKFIAQHAASVKFMMERATEDAKR